jgi:hypothetical protein
MVQEESLIFILWKHLERKQFCSHAQSEFSFIILIFDFIVIFKRILQFHMKDFSPSVQCDFNEIDKY